MLRRHETAHPTPWRQRHGDPGKEARMKTKGRREYIQVLRLLEIFQVPIVAAAIEDAIRLNVIGPQARLRA